MVTITPNKTVVCTQCGDAVELRSRSQETHVIAAQTFERRHRCSVSTHARAVEIEQPTEAIDRWKSLFKNTNLP